MLKFLFFLCFRNRILGQLRSLILATDITRQQEFLSRFKVTSYFYEVYESLNAQNILFRGARRTSTELI